MCLQNVIFISQVYIKSEIEKLVCRGFQEPKQKFIPPVSGKKKALNITMPQKDSIKEENKKRLNKPGIRETWVKQNGLLKKMDTKVISNATFKLF